MALKRTLARRTVLASSLACLAAGCLRTGETRQRQPREEQVLGTAVIGLRIDDTAALRVARDRYRWVVSPWSFLQRDPRASLSFGRVDTGTGAIDLPRLARLLHLKAVVETKGFGTEFTAVRLVPGRYATLQARLLEQPNDIYSSERVLPLSGTSYLEAAAHELGGYEFTVAPDEVVYVGTMVLSLKMAADGTTTFAAPQIVDESSIAARSVSELAGRSSAKVTRVMIPVQERRQPGSRGTPLPRVG